jgi:tripartite-type tricarboxylate transporter receptor subunit TctC
MFGVLPASLGYIRAGTLRALAVTSTQRQPLVPDIPALSEFLPGYEASGWYGIVAPKGTPPEIIDKLNKEIDAGLRDEKTRKRFVDLGCDVFTGPPAAFDCRRDREMEQGGPRREYQRRMKTENRRQTESVLRRP